uniref:Interleukin family protein n=1 Tax=Chelonoidis abingdonii TaxID=106734 RepID=A0A8C0ILQ8_CHEAB
MRLYSLFRSGLLLVLLCLFIAEGKKASSGKNSCRKGMISKVTENLYVKATTLKASIPKDFIKNRRLLKKTTKKLFMKNCSVRDQLLSFYVKNVFGGLGIGSDKVYIVNAFQTLCSCFMKNKTRISKCFETLGEKGIYKAISELDILLHWIQTYIETIK